MNKSKFGELNAYKYKYQYKQGLTVYIFQKQMKTVQRRAQKKAWELMRF